MIVLASRVFAAADLVEEILKEQTKARQGTKGKRAAAPEQIENLKRDREINQLQQQLDQLKQSKPEASQPQQPDAAQTQRQWIS